MTYNIQTDAELLFASNQKIPFNPISTLKISSNELIFISSRNIIFVVNKDLQHTDEKGLIFTLDADP